MGRRGGVLRSLAAGVGVALVLAGAGCDASASRPSSEPAHPGTPATSSPPGVTRARRPLRETRRSTVPLTGAHPGWVTLVPGHGIAYESGPLRGKQTLYLSDVTTHRQRVVARIPPGGLTWVSASSRYLVWGQQATAREDPAAPVAWRLFAYDLASGDHRRFDSGFTAAPPLPKVSGTTVIWARFLGVRLKRCDVWAENLTTGHRHRVLTRVRSAQVTSNGHLLVYNLTEQFHPRQHTYRTDLFGLRNGTDRPARLTHTGNVDMPTLDHNTLTWRAGLSGRIAARQLPHGATVVLADGDQGFLSAGDGYVADLADGPHGQTVRLISVRDPTHTPAYLTRPPGTGICVSCGISVAGRQVAWGVQQRLPTGLARHGTAIISTIANQ